MGARNALAVLRQYGRAKGVTPSAMNVLTFMALQTHDDDPEPTFYGGRRRIAAGCMGADIDLTDDTSTLSKTDANRVSECLSALCVAGAITQTRAGAARKATGRGRDFATSAAYRLNIDDAARQWVRSSLGSRQTRPEIPGASASQPRGDRPGNPGRVSGTQARKSRARVAETRPEIPGTQRSTSEEVEAEEARASHPEPTVPRPPADETQAPSPHCSDHQDNPTGDPCRACGDTRRRRAAWDAERQQHEQAWRDGVRRWLAWADRQPMCDCGKPGGDLVRPDIGALHCPLCRKKGAA